MKTATTNKVKAVLEDIAKKFSENKFPETAAKVFLERNGTPSDVWSFFNRVQMYAAGTVDARGYRQWQKAGRQVKKGSKAIYILGPRLTTIDEDKKEKKQVLTGFRCIPVFRVEDTEGEPIEYVSNPPPLPPLHKVAEKWGHKVTYDGTREGENGSFNVRTGEIRLCVADPSTFFHELAHAAHSKIEELKAGQDPEQEAVAQLSACVLARLYGYDADAYSWHYIASYAGDKEPAKVGRLCCKVLIKTQKVLKMILQAA